MCVCVCVQFIFYTVPKINFFSKSSSTDILQDVEPDMFSPLSSPSFLAVIVCLLYLSPPPKNPQLNQIHAGIVVTTVNSFLTSEIDVKLNEILMKSLSWSDLNT